MALSGRREGGELGARGTKDQFIMARLFKVGEGARSLLNRLSENEQHLLDEMCDEQVEALRKLGAHAADQRMWAFVEFKQIVFRLCRQAGSDTWVLEPGKGPDDDDPQAAAAEAGRKRAGGRGAKRKGAKQRGLRAYLGIPLFRSTRRTVLDEVKASFFEGRGACAHPAPSPHRNDKRTRGADQRRIKLCGTYACDAAPRQERTGRHPGMRCDGLLAYLAANPRMRLIDDAGALHPAQPSAKESETNPQ